MNIFFYDIMREKNLGTESTHVYEVLNNILKQGHNVLFYKSEKPMFKRETIANSKLNIWGNLRFKKPIIGIFLIFATEMRMFLNALLLLRKEKKKPDIVYYRHTMFNFGCLMSRWLGVPAIKEVNGLLANEMQVTGASRGFALKIINRIEKASIGKADRIIVVTSKLKDTLMHEYNIQENKIEVIENGANIDLFRPMPIETSKKELNLNPGHSYICFVGNFAAWQGLEYLIRCVPFVHESCPDARFLLVGDGTLKSKLLEMARELGVSEKVIFTGMVAYEKVPLYINSSEVCVAPFIKMRNERIGLSPLKLYEYMACGKSVVASNITGVGNVLEKRTAGISIEPENPDELSKAIIKLLKDEKLRDEMGRNGREYVVKEHSWKSVAMKIISICEESIKE